jgi:hypothetical protein
MIRWRMTAMVAFVWLLLPFTGFALASGLRSAAASSNWPKINRLGDGSTVSVWKNGRVVQRARGGKVVSDSTFESYAVYERWVTFMASFQKAIKRNDRSYIAREVDYPVRWSGGTIAGRPQLLGEYSAIFRPAVVKAILAADARALFCQNVSQVMLDSGVIWGDDYNGRLAISTVNSPIP